jgi:hypothetical protein
MNNFNIESKVLNIIIIVLKITSLSAILKIIFLILRVLLSIL